MINIINDDAEQRYRNSRYYHLQRLNSGIIAQSRQLCCWNMHPIGTTSTDMAIIMVIFDTTKLQNPGIKAVLSYYTLLGGARTIILGHCGHPQIRYY